MYISITLICLSILASAIIGLWRYKTLEISLRIMAVLLLITSISEISCLFATLYKNYYLKLSIFHVFSVIQGSLISAYFVYATGMKKPLTIVAAAIAFWTLAGVGNALFLQPLGTLNSNMLMLESLAIITMSLYFIYGTLKHDWADNVFRFVHFRISVLWLVFWGVTFFFWGFVAILWKNQWQHATVLMYAQSVVEFFVYVGFAFSLYKADKKMIIHEAR